MLATGLRLWRPGLDCCDPLSEFPCLPQLILFIQLLVSYPGHPNPTWDPHPWLVFPSGRCSRHPQRLQETTIPLSGQSCAAVFLSILRDRAAVKASPRRGDGQPTPAPGMAKHRGPIDVTWW